MTTQNSPSHFFSRPVFPEDENKTRQAYFLSLILPAAVLTLLLIMITRIRQKTALDSALRALENFILNLDRNEPPEILAQDLREALDGHPIVTSTNDNH